MNPDTDVNNISESLALCSLHPLPSLPSPHTNKSNKRQRHQQQQQQQQHASLLSDDQLIAKLDSQITAIPKSGANSTSNLSPYVKELISRFISQRAELARAHYNTACRESRELLVDFLGKYTAAHRKSECAFCFDGATQQSFASVLDHVLSCNILAPEIMSTACYSLLSQLVHVLLHDSTIVCIPHRFDSDLRRFVRAIVSRLWPNYKCKIVKEDDILWTK